MIVASTDRGFHYQNTSLGVFDWSEPRKCSRKDYTLQAVPVDINITS